MCRTAKLQNFLQNLETFHQNAFTNFSEEPSSTDWFTFSSQQPRMFFQEEKKKFRKTECWNFIEIFQDVTLSFEEITELVKCINCKLQNRIYESKKFAENLRPEGRFAVKIKDKFLKENIKEVEILEGETANAISEDKKNNFLKPYHEEHILLQNPPKIEKEKEQEIGNYLKLASPYFKKDIQSAKNINKENKQELYFQRKRKIKNDRIVSNKPTFKDWFIHDEVVKRVVDVTEEDKAFIHDLIK